MKEFKIQTSPTQKIVFETQPNGSIYLIVDDGEDVGVTPINGDHAAIIINHLKEQFGI